MLISLDETSLFFLLGIIRHYSGTSAQYFGSRGVCLLDGLVIYFQFNYEYILNAFLDYYKYDFFC